MWCGSSYFTIKTAVEGPFEALASTCQSARCQTAWSLYRFKSFRWRKSLRKNRQRWGGVPWDVTPCELVGVFWLYSHNNRSFQKTRYFTIYVRFVTLLERWYNEKWDGSGKPGAWNKSEKHTQFVSEYVRENSNIYDINNNDIDFGKNMIGRCRLVKEGETRKNDQSELIYTWKRDLKDVQKRRQLTTNQRCITSKQSATEICDHKLVACAVLTLKNISCNEFLDNLHIGQVVTRIEVLYRERSYKLYGK